MKYWGIFVLLGSLLMSSGLSAQTLSKDTLHQRKSLVMQRTQEPPNIDGKLDEVVWENAPVAKDFVMWRPDNGAREKPGFKSEVKIVYDDRAIYFGAMLYDPQPDSIPRELGQRDDNNRNADWFAMWINPYSDGLSDINFFVSAAGVQTDSRTTDNGDDLNWNAVWKSKVSMVENGWIVEVEIPYAALRFPDTDVQTWSLNLGRSIRRFREVYTWSYIDNSVGNPELYAGLLVDIKNIESPLRLSLLPYVSGYYNNFGGENGFEYNVGMDLKYGLTEAFTLDMTLIPDFGQVAFDNQVLNLSPFEVRFDENRQFFTEGTELFNKGGLFYSRRIGNAPTRPGAAYEDLGVDEIVVNNPNKVQLINATKVSGRTADKLGVGFFNAVTGNTYASIRDTITGETRDVLTESVANYNVLVFDQRFNQNSSVTFVNTNVLRKGDFRDANSTAILFELPNKQQSHRLSGAYKQSLVWNGDKPEFGFASNLSIDKISGQWRYWGGVNVESDKFNPNDLGFLFNNNEFNQWVGGSYQIFQPEGAFNSYGLGASVNSSFLYNPRAFSSVNFNSWGWFTLRSFNGFGYNIWASPLERNDWFEARVPGRKLVKMPHAGGNVWVSTDYRKKFAFDLGVDYTAAQTYATMPINAYWYSYNISPRFRFNDRFSLIYRFRQSIDLHDIGWVNQEEDGTIIMGERNIQTTVNTLTGSYIFNNVMGLRLNFRHYWSSVEYVDYHALGDDGYLAFSPYSGGYIDETGYNSNHDVNLNFWNIDLVYSWWFAPGSEVRLVWKNAISTYDNTLTQGFYSNLQETWNSPISNSLSIKVLYFLDGQYLIKK